jgi:2,4-diketo-3-deoxy-L-fuconate hydrolase
MTLRFANVAGRAALVDDDGGWHDVHEASDGELSSDPMDAWSSLDALHRLAERIGTSTARGPIADAELGAPIPRPRCVFAIGLNYRSHAEETNRPPSAAPVVFTKFPSCLVGASEPVVLGSATDDYEAELVVVIGRGGRSIARKDAWDHVGGLTIGQDISDRTLQFSADPAHFDLGKSRDTYGPTGPYVVATGAFDAPDDLAITCDVNGERRQSDRTSNLLFDVPTLVSYLSGILTLAPGDLIFTGTPAGVGATSGKFLVDGDVITTTIEGIGTLTTRCTSGEDR